SLTESKQPSGPSARLFHLPDPVGGGPRPKRLLTDLAGAVRGLRRGRGIRLAAVAIPEARAVEAAAAEAIAAEAGVAGLDAGGGEGAVVVLGALGHEDHPDLDVGEGRRVAVDDDVGVAADVHGRGGVI